MGINVVSIQPGYFKSDIVKSGKEKLKNFGVGYLEEAKKYYPKFNYFDINADSKKFFFFFINLKFIFYSKKKKKKFNRQT